MINIQGWDWLMVGYMAVGLLIAAHEHGKPITRKRNFWVIVTRFGTIFGMAWLGGMFR